jgi:hypothetical protein
MGGGRVGLELGHQTSKRRLTKSSKKETNACHDNLERRHREARVSRPQLGQDAAWCLATAKLPGWSSKSAQIIMSAQVATESEQQTRLFIHVVDHDRRGRGHDVDQVRLVLSTEIMLCPTAGDAIDVTRPVSNAGDFPSLHT